MKNLNIKKINKNLNKNFIYLTINKFININYIHITNNEIKNYFFTGLCIAINKNKTLYLINKLKKEKILFKFNLTSPIIFNINIIKNIRKKYRINKLYFLYFKN
jgi:ribosomal protein L19